MGDLVVSTNSAYFTKKMRILASGPKFYCANVCIHALCSHLCTRKKKKKRRWKRDLNATNCNLASKQKKSFQSFFFLWITWKTLELLLTFNKCVYDQDWLKKDCLLKHQSDEKNKKLWSSSSPSGKSDTFYMEIKSYSIYDTKWDKYMSRSENKMVYYCII